MFAVNKQFEVFSIFIDWNKIKKFIEQIAYRKLCFYV